MADAISPKRLNYVCTDTVLFVGPVISLLTVLRRLSCADPEIFMRGGPTKMVIFGHRRGGGGGVQPPKIPKLPFFR